MSVFRDLIGNPDRTPGWMRRPEDAGILEPIGAAHDHFFAVHAYRLFASLPAFATVASLREIAKDRHVLTFPEEPFSSQQQRCREWLPAHFDAGLPAGVLKQSQILWTTNQPTMRLVAGNSLVAMWSTIYGDDAVATLYGKTPGTFEFVRQDVSNWDWWSSYYADPQVSATEPSPIHNYWLIVYEPDAFTDYGSTTPENRAGSYGSPDVTGQFGVNVSDLATYWARDGARITGWILAKDPASFDPAGNNTITPGGYPDGTWWRTATSSGSVRLDTARYYQERKIPGVTSSFPF